MPISYPLAGVSLQNILVRATNWVGDAVMCLPALRALRLQHPNSRITVLARPWVADLYRREPFADEVILLHAARGPRDLRGKWAAAQSLRGHRFDCAVLLQNAFEAALIAWLARIPIRTGYNRDGRRLLLTHPIDLPPSGRHERFYYLELLTRAGLIPATPQDDVVRLECAPLARAAGLQRFQQLGLAAPVIGVSPGAAYGTAKRWIPENFAQAAITLARNLSAQVALFGSPGEAQLCQSIADAISAAGIGVRSFAGQTALNDYIDLAAACHVYLTNDSGAMHISSALGVPTVAIFGATDHIGTGPAGHRFSIVRHDVDCSPCLLRECPIDHRCMTLVTPDQVVAAALKLL
ncbi:MAG: lipopolysaccharide heptosyltransferase II [Acidobacteria bacterium]|nr:lipopolysaccharide heptosyltransferase II [Acidobacteriota bacterium]